MNSFVTVFTFGAITGLQTALLAIGLVLIYRASRFLNFAQGQMGAVAAALLGVLVLQLGVPYWIALATVLVAGGVLGAAIERLLSWRLFEGSRLSLLVATIGVSQLALLAVLVGPLRGNSTKLNLHGYPQPFAFRWTIASVTLNSSQVTTAICAPLIAIGLFAFLNRTRTGRAVRGAASNPDAARLAGVSVRRVSLLVWIIAGVVSSLAAILNAPSQPAMHFAAAAGLGLLLRGLAAGLVGGMSDFRVAFGAAIGLGILEQGVIQWVHVPGAADVAILLVLVVTFVVRGTALQALSRARDALTVVGTETPVPERIRELFVVRRSGILGWSALLGLVAVAPTLPGLRTQERAVFLLFMVSYAIVGLGLTVLTGWAGQVSLGQFAFLGVGAYAAASVARHNQSVPLMLLVAGVVTAVVSVLVGLVAVRLRGLFLGIVTLGFAFAAQSWLFRQKWVAGDTGSIARISRTNLFGLGIRTIRGEYFVGVAVLLGTILALHSLRRTAAGRALIAVRDNDDHAATYGLPPTAVKITGLAIAGFVTGMAGAVWGMAQGQWTFSSFDPTMSFVMLAIVIVGGLGTLYGPILGSIVVFAWPYLVPNADTLAVRSFTSGILLLVVLLFSPGGIASLFTRLRERAYRALAASLPEPFVPDESARPLEVSNVSVSFGGLRALDKVSIYVERGEIVGLIGGNGAGKSTLLNSISGHIRPTAGEIRVQGHDVGGLAPEYRPYIGLTRTFQDAYLFPGLTVRETVMAAMDHDDRTGTLGALVGAPWVLQAERVKRTRADEILESFGIADRAETFTSALSTGMRRICDLAAIAASNVEVVLLDEPTAGLAQREVEAFGPMLRRLRDDRGCSMLIVEHDMPLLMGLCDRIYCLEQGRVIAVGTAEEIRSNPQVVASYLGSETAAIERSGSATTGTTKPKPRGGRSAKAPADQPTRAGRAAGVSAGSLVESGAPHEQSPNGSMNGSRNGAAAVDIAQSSDASTVGPGTDVRSKKPRSRRSST